MKMHIGRYYITSDDRNFVVQEKRIVEEGRLTKAENVGKEKLVDIGYFTSLDGLFKFLCKCEVLRNDDLLDVKRGIDQISEGVKRIELELGLR